MNNNEQNTIPVENKGRISEIQKNTYTISFQGKEIFAKLKGSFREVEASQLPVVGDYVIFKFNPIGDSVIESV